MSTSPIERDPDEFGMNLNLDAHRSARAEKKKPPTLTIGNRELVLPIELPLDVLAPLVDLDVDVSFLIREVMNARKTGIENASEDLASAVIDMLVLNPNLPKDVVRAVQAMARELLGGEQYEHLVAQKLSLPDVGLLAKWALRRYGVSLGEASRSSDSSESSGTTSKPTSPGETETSETSGGTRQTPAS